MGNDPITYDIRWQPSYICIPEIDIKDTLDMLLRKHPLDESNKLREIKSVSIVCDENISNTSISYNKETSQHIDIKVNEDDMVDPNDISRYKEGRLEKLLCHELAHIIHRKTNSDFDAIKPYTKEHLCWDILIDAKLEASGNNPTTKEARSKEAMDFNYFSCDEVAIIWETYKLIDLSDFLRLIKTNSRPTLK